VGGEDKQSFVGERCSRSLATPGIIPPLLTSSTRSLSRNDAQ